MDPNNNQQPPVQNPAPAAPSAAPVGAAGPNPVVPPPQPGIENNANVVKNQDQPQGRDKKKLIVVSFLILIILLILAVVGYYAYSTMMSSSTEEVPTATITEVPTVSPEPTIPPDPIEGEEDLNEVIDELDNATDEAALDSEVQGLQSDSNF